MALLAYGSIPDVGSSSTTILEPPMRAIPTLEGSAEEEDKDEGKKR